MFLDKEPVLMYFIENVAFQFDSLDRIDKEDKWVLSEAASNEEYTIKDVIITIFGFVPVYSSNKLEKTNTKPE